MRVRHILYVFVRTYKNTSTYFTPRPPPLPLIELDAMRTFEIYKCDTNQAGFTEYIERFQTFIMFFLDASVFVDTDDPKFNYYVMLVPQTPMTMM